MPITAIFFDLDGTLVDSAAGVALALNTALTSAELPSFDLSTVRSWIGDGPDALIQRALDACQLRDVDLPTLAARLRRRFDAATLATPSAQGSAYDGITALLAQLDADYPMAVITNKPTTLARAVLEAAGLLKYFVQVRGADTPPLRKPSPLMIQQAARQFGVPTENVLMVGDGPADLQAARAAGSLVAWASWGYGPPPATPAADLWRLDAPAALLALLKGPALTRPNPQIH